MLHFLFQRSYASLSAKHWHQDNNYTLFDYPIFLWIHIALNSKLNYILVCWSYPSLITIDWYHHLTVTLIATVLQCDKIHFLSSQQCHKCSKLAYMYHHLLIYVYLFIKFICQTCNHGVCRLRLRIWAYNLLVGWSLFMFSHT